MPAPRHADSRDSCRKHKRKRPPTPPRFHGVTVTCLAAWDLKETLQEKIVVPLSGRISTVEDLLKEVKRRVECVDPSHLRALFADGERLHRYDHIDSVITRDAYLVAAPSLTLLQPPAAASRHTHSSQEPRKQCRKEPDPHGGHGYAVPHGNFKHRAPSHSLSPMRQRRCRQVSKQQHSPSASNAPVSSSQQQWAQSEQPLNPTAKAIASFQAAGNKELTIQEGNLLEILSDTIDGWSFYKNVITFCEGWAPAWVIERTNKAEVANVNGSLPGHSRSCATRWRCSPQPQRNTSKLRAQSRQLPVATGSDANVYARSNLDHNCLSVDRICGRSGMMVDRVELHLRDGSVSACGGCGGSEVGPFDLLPDEVLLAVTQEYNEKATEKYMGLSVSFGTSLGRTIEIRGWQHMKKPAKIEFKAPSNCWICGLIFNDGRLTDIKVGTDDSQQIQSSFNAMTRQRHAQRAKVATVLAEQVYSRQTSTSLGSKPPCKVHNMQGSITRKSLASKPPCKVPRMRGSITRMRSVPQMANLEVMPKEELYAAENAGSCNENLENVRESTIVTSASELDDEESVDFEEI